MAKIIIVDGNSLINRAFFALKDLRNSKGIYTGGVLKFTEMVLMLIDDFEPTHFVIAFDMKGPTFRHLSYEAYKGTRTGMSDELAMQMPITKEILDALNISRVELQGYEADDLIGTIAKQAKNAGIEAHIITGDKDALQLAAEGVHVHITKKGITNLKDYDDEAIMEEWGVTADHVIDFKGLSGDSADNIPGVKGVGPKTAQKLLAQFKTVENLIENVEEVENQRIRNLIIEHAEEALMSKRLATIHQDVPIEIDFEAFKIVEPNLEATIGLMKQYELTSLLNRIKPTEKPAVETIAIEDVICDPEKVIKAANKAGKIYIRTAVEPSKERYMTCYGMAMNIDGKLYYVEGEAQLQALKPMLESDEIAISGFDVKRDYLWCLSEGIALKGIDFDGYIASYLINPARRNYLFEDILFEKHQLQIDGEEVLLGKGAKKKAYADIDHSSLKAFLCQQVSYLPILTESLMAEIKEAQLDLLLKEVELPLIEVLADMEYIGFKVDMQTLDELGTAIETKINEIETEVYRLAGENFNINSPKQLGVILFEKLGLPVGKKTKTGYSTSHDVLEKLMNKHEIIKEIIEYRMYAKLKSTYIDGLKAVVDEKERVHTSLNQTIAVTGRLSSTEPNLQNIPIRLPYGRKIRKIFIPDENCTLLDADYSQIELRVLAHLSEDDTLIKAFREGLDIHAITASQVFHVAEDEVSSLQRSRAKEVNFGIVYGMGDFGLSESLGITRKEAKSYIESYFETYPKVQTYMDGLIEQCKKDGYVETVLHRRRDIADINHSNFMLRSAAERTARNTPIQGSAADIIKLAMIKVYHALKENEMATQLILQVHDELILNVPEGELEKAKAILKEAMETAYMLDVPLKVDMNTGASWYDAK
ncbi:DNA polymerase I [Fusibacter paucivorans]|uniref:DNA polymerase I n=1 Tax=Fusibacter paucivorans TaxID=76009 RepID=A0ABS5PQH2_9FIRM|nr:DNA polymerase I [Fusibacter paucivorans]MBS7527313.1 DNA polymerase I [Fusibacter paucivorans]